MNVTAYVSLGLVGCHREAEVEIPDEDIEGLSEVEQERVIEEYVRDWMFQQIDWGWRQ
jgi:stress-induced morphogen